jgi:hypothetical protein
MRVAYRSYGGRGHGRHATPCYRCLPGSHVSRNKTALEDLIVDLLITRLSRPDAAELLVARVRDEQAAAAAEDAAALRGRLDEAAVLFAAGQIDRRQLSRISETVRPELDRAEARAQVVDDAPLFAGLVDASDVRAAWNTLPLTRQRAIVDALLSIRVLPSRTGRSVFDPDAVETSWRR